MSFLLRVLRFMPRSLEACETLSAAIFIAVVMKILSIIVWTL